MASVRADLSLITLRKTKVCIIVLTMEVKEKTSLVLLTITVLFTYWVKLISEIILAEAVQTTTGIHLIH